LSLTRNISSVLLTNILVFLLGVPAGIVIARVLGPEGVGIYALIMLVPGLLYQLGNLGLGGASIYFTGTKRFDLSDVTSNSLVFGFAVMVLLGALFAAAYRLFLYPFFKDVEPLFIYLILLSLPFSLVSVYFKQILLARFKVTEFNLLSLLQPLLMLVGVALLLILFQAGMLSVVVLCVVVPVITFGASALLVRRLTVIRLSVKLRVLKESLGYGVKVYLANIFTFLSYRLDILLVSYFLGATQVGFYALAVAMAEMAWFIPNAVKTILFPQVSSSDRASSGRLAAMVARHTLVLSVLACAALAAVGRWAIELLYGPEFLPSFLPLLILLPGIIGNSVASLAAAYLSGIGKPVFATYASLASLAVNVALNLILIPMWGIAGAAAATSVSYCLNCLILLLAFYRQSRIEPRDVLLMKAEDLKPYLGVAKRILRLSPVGTK